ncbi:MAG: FAD-dependent monooxygenase, partial [Planctomycetes bacterium]|nr:FAD-dependent monooxygenase [Planctomycetota bacterium]
MPRCDVAIVGAGPAGAVTAWILAGLDPALRIILCDATATAGRKPCGEYLSPGGVGVLERAGLLADVLATGALPLRSLTMRAPAGGIRVPFAPVLGLVPQAGHGLGVRRERFDGCLRAAAARRVE